MNKKCENKYDDTLTTCPNCTTDNKEKDSKSKGKTKKAILGSVIAGLVIVVIALIVLIKPLTYSHATTALMNQNYKNAADSFLKLGDYKDSQSKYKYCMFELANSLFDEGNYEDAKPIYESLGNYEKADEKAKKCNFYLSIDGQFILDFAKGISARWDNSDNDPDEPAKFIEYREKLIDNELNFIQKYQNENFNDKQLGNKAKEYIKELNNQKNALQYYVGNNSKYIKLWDEAYDNRTLLMSYFFENYDIELDEKYNDTKKELLNNAISVKEERNIEKEVKKMLKYTNFRVVKDSYGYKDYEAKVKNTSGVDFDYFSYEITLIDKSGVKIATRYTNTINRFNAGDVALFSFSTDENFETLELAASYSVE